MSYYLVIHTQDIENYGAHDWDGKAECPQYWKYKGGVSLAIPLKGADLTGRDANYAARSINMLAEHDMLTDSEYFKTYYKDHEVVEACDLYIAHDHDDMGPDGSEYEFFSLVRFAHLPEHKQLRFCWIKKTRPK